MTLDIFGYTLLSLIGTLALNAAFQWWRSTKKKTSIYAADETIDDVAMSALSSLGSGNGRRRRDGKTELHPPFGMRLIAPAIATVVLMTTDIAPLLASFGATEPHVQSWVLTGLLFMLALATLWLNFAQKVVYDDSENLCQDVQLTTQRRSLEDLVDIAVHPKRPALVLTFAEQDRLYVPKFLTGRAEFVGRMRVIAKANQRRGLTSRPEGLAAQLGF